MDTIDFSQFGAALEVDMATGTFTVGGGSGDNAIDGIEHLIATLHDDRISGSGNAETLTKTSAYRRALKT